MTARRMIILTCDGSDCEQEASEGQWFDTVKEARRYAYQLGWVRARRGGFALDLCPDHRPNRDESAPAR
jgi:hypothetical protein